MSARHRRGVDHLAHASHAIVDGAVTIRHLRARRGDALSALIDFAGGISPQVDLLRRE